jgi:hypothetical protein
MANKNLVRRPVNKTGRNSFGPGFVRHFHYVLDSPAYRDLSPVARGVYMVLKRWFNGTNNGNIYCSVRDLSKELHCSKDTASAALRELVDHGFIKCQQRGSFNWKRGMASRWSLTEENLGDHAATKDFMRWTPQQQKDGPRKRTKRPDRGTLSVEGVVKKSETVLG